MKKENNGNKKEKTLESWLWDAACSIRGAKDAPKFKDFILPLVFVKRLCDVFDDEVDNIAKNVKTRKKAFKLLERDHELVRFYLPLKPEDEENDSIWSVIRKLSNKIGEQLTTIMRDIVSILNVDENRETARGLMNYSSGEVQKIKGLRSSLIKKTLGYKPYDEIIHRDNMVLL
jgi:type I restriction-modification system DNA methylase subunit